MEKPRLLEDLDKVARQSPEEAQRQREFFGKLADATRVPTLHSALATEYESDTGDIANSQLLSVAQLKEFGKGALAREVKRLNAKLDEADMLSLIAKAKGPQFQHREAFMLMTYVSDGGTDVKLVWNSRDGVTPFTMVIDGLKYTHQIAQMQGPFFDRPEGIVGQWETRTEAKMMEAWHRTLERAVLAGRMPREKANAMADNADIARSWNLNIGLRSMPSGLFTDEATK